MASTVKLRRPRNIIGSNLAPGSSTVPRNRPKSWNEFNSRFQAISTPINIENVAKEKNSTSIAVDHPVSFRRPRPLSTSLIDVSGDTETSLPSPDIQILPPTTSRSISSKFKSFLAPNPWNGSRTFPRRSMDSKQNIRSMSQSNAEKLSKSNEKICDYDQEPEDYDVTNRHSAGIISPPEVPKTIDLRSVSMTRITKSENSSDIDSPDSAVGSIVTSQCGTSSERSPKWGRRNRKSCDLDSVSTFSDKSREDANEDKAYSDSRGETFKVPSLQVQDMDVRIIDTSDMGKGSRIHVIPLSPNRSPGTYVTSSKSITSSNANVTSQITSPNMMTSRNAITSPNTMTSQNVMTSSKTLDLQPNVHRAVEKPDIVPSPLKSCYATVSNYEITVEEVSDSENSSVNGDFVSDLSRSNIEDPNPGYDGDKSAEEYAMYQATPPPLKSIAKVTLNSKIQTIKYISDEEDVRVGGGYGRGNGSRRTRKKNDTWDPELLIKKFRDSSILHLERVKKIYEESRKKRDDLLLGLKITMAKNGHRF